MSNPRLELRGVADGEDDETVNRKGPVRDLGSQGALLAFATRSAWSLCNFGASRSGVWVHGEFVWLELEAASMRQNIHVLAYLDPGTGSMLLQVVLGGFAAVAVGGRVMWQRMTGRASKVETTPVEQKEPEPTE